MSDFDDDDLLDLVGGNETPKKATTKKTSVKKAKKPVKKKRRRDESEDEESEFTEEEEEDDDLFLSEEDDDEDEESEEEEEDLELLEEIDESQLSGLTEFQREQLLSERAEKKQKLLERLEIKKRLKMKRSSKRGASESKQKKTKKLQELKDKRNRKKGIQTKVEVSSEEEEEEEEDYLSKVKNSYSTVTSGAPKDQVPITVEDLNSIRLSRIQLESWIFTPSFSEFVPNYFVRLLIGSKNGDKVYRVCRIAEVTEYHRSYKLNGHPTQKALKLKHGKAEKVFLMDVVSNEDFTKGEFDRWFHTMKAEKQRIPLKKEIEKLKQALEEKLQAGLTEEDINYMIQEKRKLGIKKNLAMEKINLIARKEEAESNGDFILAQSLEQQIEEINQQTMKTDPSNDVFAKLNQRNRILNLEEGSKAEQLARQEKLQKIKEGKPGSDPFARIKSAPLQINPVVGPISPTLKSAEVPESPLVSDHSRRNSETNAVAIPSESKTLFENVLADVDIDLDI